MTNTEFNKKVTCGNDFVAVRIIENCENLKVGNIYLPQTTEQNTRLAFCQVESIGASASERLGVKNDDYVMIDRLATFGHTAPIACLKYDSVICLTNSDKSDFFPLKDMLFVQPDEKSDIEKVGNVFLMNPQDRLNLGRIIKMNLEKSEKYPFEVGQKVMLTRGADVVQFGEVKVHIFKKDMIICTVDEEV